MSQSEAHIRITLDIWEAIMLRDFSKRQRKVLDLILRLSWGCGRSAAIIPRQRAFEIVGVSETKVKTELEWLVKSNVIGIDGDLYYFNNDTEQWQVSPVMPFVPEKLTDLVSLNLSVGLPKTGSSQNGKFVAETTDKLPEKASLSVENLSASCKEDIKKDKKKDITNVISKEKEKNQEIFDFWNEHKVVVHRKLTDEMKRAITVKLKDYSAIELCKAIANYAEIVNSQDYYWNHRWTLQEFLSRKSAVERFLDGDVARENYRIKGGQHGINRGHTEKPKQLSPFASIKPIISGPGEDGDEDLSELRQ